VRILVVNAGSSSVKLSLIDGDDRTIAVRELDAPHSTLDQSALRGSLADGLGDVDAVGHRIVHGGERYREAVVVDRDVERGLRELVDLAPLHQPKSLAALDAVSGALRGVPAVACFDTAFHATLPAAAATYALPDRWRSRWGVRRYGFHGLSHAWVAHRVPDLLDAAAGLRVVSCHLGAGASVCAIADGRSVDTTMGFTPLEGLVMATRSGSVDPGLITWLLEHAGIDERELAEALEHESGLLGLTGSADMREVLERANAGDDRARLGLEVYVHRLRGAVAAMAASLGGLDALVFTGGVGEHSSQVRALASEGLQFLGVVIDQERNCAGDQDRDISALGAGARSVVVRAREDLEIVRQTRGALSAP
jgi:acetate kinase